MIEAIQQQIYFLFTKITPPIITSPLKIVKAVICSLNNSQAPNKVTNGSKYKKAPTREALISLSACAQMAYAAPEQKIPKNKIEIHPLAERCITAFMFPVLIVNGEIIIATNMNI